jgi:hypothetical protein
MIKNFFRIIFHPLIKKFQHLEQKLEDNKQEIIYKLELLQNSIARVEFRQLEITNSINLNDYEYQVYSQWGEDGIIQFLVKHISIEKKIFVEFGVEDYKQSNTRFLLVNNNWSGLILDSSQDNISAIKNDKIYWNFNLKAICSFVSAENINEILIDNGLTGEIGLLSIDVDGNDYWIWKAITAINPIIVVIEYNYRFGTKTTVTIPYDKAFQRSEAHHSMIYFGSSLKALLLLAKSKGYSFIGCNKNGVNAFFVRDDKINSVVHEVSLEEGYSAGKFCEYRDENGVQKKKTPEEEIELLESLNLPLIDINDEHFV